LRPMNRIHLILILGQAHQDAVLSDMSKGVQFYVFLVILREFPGQAYVQQPKVSG